MCHLYHKNDTDKSIHMKDYEDSENTPKICFRNWTIYTYDWRITSNKADITRQADKILKSTKQNWNKA